MSDEIGFENRVGHLVGQLGWLNFDLGCPTICPVLLRLMGNWQNWLSSWARWWNITVNPTHYLTRCSNL